MEISLGEVILTFLTVAFGAWAGVILHIGNGIRKDLKEDAEHLNKYIVQTERRLAIIETFLGFNHGDEG